VTIDILPDDVLVEIFNLCVNIYYQLWETSRNTWHPLVHVCRRWRYLVFASPRRLNLRLEYRGHRPMSEAMDAWPVLPVVISRVETSLRDLKSDQQWDSTLAALESEHYSRIREIYISVYIKSSWERFVAATQKPFPELTDLAVWMSDVVPVLPGSFLGGSAPRLRTLDFNGIPFPSLPKLLLSANDLVKLLLWDIPDSGYISPHAMATALTLMTRLETLRLHFRSPRSRPDPESRPPPPPTRLVLPALTVLFFKGVYEYLEDLLARVDTPLLDNLSITYFMDLDFDVPQLHRLIDHTEVFKTFNRAVVSIFNQYINLNLCSKTGVVDDDEQLEIEISCRESDYQLSSLAQVCTSSFPLISALEEFEIWESDDLEPSHWKDNVEDPQWVELLDPFTTLRNLYLTDEIAQRVCGALQELSRESATEVLPTLQNLFVGQALQEAMEPFVAARQLSGHPVVVHRWEEWDKWNSVPGG
jgi:F-box-like